MQRILHLPSQSLISMIFRRPNDAHGAFTPAELRVARLGRTRSPTDTYRWRRSNQQRLQYLCMVAGLLLYGEITRQTGKRRRIVARLLPPVLVRFSVDTQLTQNRHAKILHLRAGELARMGDIYLKARLDFSGPSRQHHNPICHVDRFFDVMGN